STLPRLAAIDIGTNSMRLVVAEVQPDGSYRVLDEDREMTRLGRGLYRDGRLGDTPMQQSLQALGRMKAIADGFAVAELRAIATAAVREAANGRDFVSEAWRRHRVRLEVVPAEEEARLAFRSVTRHFDLDDQLTAIVDIGGGSTEVILAAGGLVEQVVSLPLGAVRLAERYCKSDPLRQKHWKALRRTIDQTIEDAIGKPPFAAEVMIGSGGTFTNLAAMAQAERDGKVTTARDYQLSRAEITRLLARLCEQVARLAAELFDALRDAYALPPTGADILRAAALLHVIGYLINHERLHKHSYHLIMHGDLRGFSAREIELIANVARYHRRAFPKKSHANFARLDRGERRLVRRLAGILRVADGLDRTHGQVVERVRCRTGDGWVRIHTSAARDPSIELEDAKRKAALSERAFGSDLDLVWSRPKGRS